MSDRMSVLVLDDDETPSRCDNCDWKGPANDTVPIARLEERMAPGEIVPVGECSECGALCYYDDDAAPEGSTQKILQELRKMQQAAVQLAAKITGTKIPPNDLPSLLEDAKVFLLGWRTPR